MTWINLVSLSKAGIEILDQPHAGLNSRSSLAFLRLVRNREDQAPLTAINDQSEGIGHSDYIDRRSKTGERSQENVARRSPRNDELGKQ